MIFISQPTNAVGQTQCKYSAFLKTRRQFKTGQNAMSFLWSIHTFWIVYVSIIAAISTRTLLYFKNQAPAYSHINNNQVFLLLTYTSKIGITFSAFSKDFLITVWDILTDPYVNSNENQRWNKEEIGYRGQQKTTGYKYWSVLQRQWKPPSRL